MAVDKWGNILAKSDVFKEDYLIVTVHPEKADSLYGKIGDVIPGAMLVVALVALVVAFWRRKRYIEVSYAE
jgi:apolipoprotein N-acyltransferase